MKKLVLVAAGFFALTFSAAAQQAPIRVNCGGPAYTDSRGQQWQADFGFNTGTSSSTTSSISGTSDPTLFQTARTNSIGPPLIYTFPVANGFYHINLLFAESTPRSEKVGARVFNVQLQGNLIFQNLDVFGTVGANTALVKGADVQVQNGSLQIEFDTVSRSAIINAIEILPTTATAPMMTLYFLYPDGTPVAGTLAYTISTSSLSFQGSTPLTNGQATCYLISSPAAMGISGQFQVNLNLTDTAGNVLWQVGLAMNPSQVNIAAVQSSSLSVVVHKL